MHMDSILDSVKKMLGIDSEYTQFDADIIMHINSVFMMIKQLGVGPSEGFSITGREETWDDYFQGTEVASVKTYMYLQVRLLFDPPTVGSVVSSYEKQVAELGWRIMIEGDTIAIRDESNSGTSEYGGVSLLSARSGDSPEDQSSVYLHGPNFKP